MTAKLEVLNVSKSFASARGSFQALLDVNFSARDGEFVALVGASGCGKSTLLRIIAGLESASSGGVRIDGSDIGEPGRERAMVFQDYSLYPWLNVFDNIFFSATLKANRRLLGSAGAAASRQRAELLLTLMGLESVRDSHPGALSGGMRQRVAIARALLNGPALLLMDEPFGALDAQTREVMHDLILHVAALERPTVLFVTHDVQEAVYLADRVVVLAPHPGRIDSIWPVDLPSALERRQELKLTAPFLKIEAQILQRIRATSGLRSDLDALRRLTRA
jgi:NitT/TauT family transport system ATP-binding protein